MSDSLYCDVCNSKMVLTEKDNDLLYSCKCGNEIPFRPGSDGLYCKCNAKMGYASEGDLRYHCECGNEMSFEAGEKIILKQMIDGRHSEELDKAIALFAEVFPIPQSKPAKEIEVRCPYCDMLQMVEEDRARRLCGYCFSEWYNQSDGNNGRNIGVTASGEDHDWS